MKTKFRIGVAVLFLTIANVSAQSIDKKACKVITESISEVERFYNDDSAGYSMALKTASALLQEVSNIESTTKYVYEGIGEELSSSDVYNWRNWYNNNKHLLFWDTELETVRLKETL